MADIWKGVNRVRTREDDESVSSTRFEEAVDAASYALMSACYPSDTIIRLGAIQACARLGLDYISILAATLESDDTLTHSEGRFKVAESLYGIVNTMRLHLGAEPREGILTSGREADERGMDPRNDPDSYGDLA